MIGRTNTGGSGGGGGGLNFRVIGGTSAPTNPKENDIWVNTNVDITSYVFCKTEPTGYEGMVWIYTGASSPVSFNALKKNDITVYPLSAYQNINGAWLKKESESYQNGKWVDWFTWFYNRGNEFSDVTGGWVCRSNGGIVNSEKRADGLYSLQTSASGAYVSNWYSQKKVNVTGLSVLHAKCISTRNNGYFRLGLLNNNTSTDITFTYGHGGAGGVSTVVGTEVQHSYDISNVTGEYYIKLNYQGGDGAEVYWTEVWAE